MVSSPEAFYPLVVHHDAGMMVPGDDARRRVRARREPEKQKRQKHADARDAEHHEYHLADDAPSAWRGEPLQPAGRRRHGTRAIGRALLGDVCSPAERRCRAFVARQPSCSRAAVAAYHDGKSGTAVVGNLQRIFQVHVLSVLS